ncbi:MAG: SMC-Scp complex subunit ScpB [Polyangiales bacterium]
MSAEDEAIAPDDEELAGTGPGPARAPPRSISERHLKTVVESLVFVAEKPISAHDIARVARADLRDVRRLLHELRDEYQGRGVQLDEVAGAWQFRSSVANAPFVRELLQAKPVRLSRAQVEALSIIAYRQPITRPEVDEVRGVDSGSALKIPLERGSCAAHRATRGAGAPAAVRHHVAVPESPFGPFSATCRCWSTPSCRPRARRPSLRSL